METITAHFKIVTPMFIGGADQSPNDGIRPPSVKGALRFWWRALNWGSVLKAANNDEAQALKMLHSKEARLFGIAADDKHPECGQGCFLLSIKTGDKTEWGINTFNQSNNSGLIYTLGQGLCEYDKPNKNFKLTRKAIDKTSFELSFLFRPTCKKQNEESIVQALQDRNSIVQALLAFGLLGGMGSKVRRGWGSISITKLSINGKDQSLPNSIEEYLQAIDNLYNNSHDEMPPFTAFSKQTITRITHSGKDALALLESAGKAMLEFRSNGRNDRGQRKIGNKPIDDPTLLRFWKTDHETMLDALKNETTVLPQRLIFGFPYNMKFSNGVGEIQLKKTKSTKGKNTNKNGYERRSSPLMIHIHQIQEKFIVIQTLMPATFLPTDEAVVVQRKENEKSAGNVVFVPDWNILANEYMNSLPLIHSINCGAKK